MPVPSTINDLVTSAIANSPQGTETAKGTIDNYLRAHAGFIAELRDGGAKTILDATSAVAHTVQDTTRERVSICNFLTDAQVADAHLRTASLDLATPFAAARAHLASLTNPPVLVFPAGIYKYSVSPNWAIQGLKLEFAGNVTFRYTGTGNAVEVNATTGGGAGDLYNIAIGTPTSKLIIEAPTTAAHGLYVKGAHHSHFCADVRGCGSSSAGVYVQFSVCSEFWLTVSRNTTGTWYGGVRPAFGLVVDRRSAGEPTSYCTFHLPVMEWCGVGIQVNYSNGNMYIGGTCEGSYAQGMILGAGATSEKIIGMDLEANSQVGAGTYGDIALLGSYNTFTDVDTDSVFQVASGATGNTIRGGIHQSIQLDSGSTTNIVDGAHYKRGLGTGSFSDAGTDNRITNTKDMQTGVFYRKILPLQSISVGASPFTYTNTNNYNVTAVVSGGVSNVLTLIRAPDTGVPLTSTNCAIMLCPGDSLKYAYGTAGFLVIYPQ